MAYPSGMQLVTVTVGSSLSFFGTPLSVKVSVSPVLGGSAVRLIWAATGQTVVAGPMEFKGDAGSIASFEIPNPDQPGFINGAGNEARNWSYLATITTDTGRWTQAFQPVAGQTTIDLDMVPDGQVSAPTSAPVPPVTSVNGQTGAVVIEGTGGGGSGGSTAWVDITGKPSSYPPATHSHAVGDVSGLQSALDAKQPAGSYATTTELTDGLAGKANTSHTHAISNVSGLQEALDAKSALQLGTTAGTAKAGDYTPAWSEVTGKPATYPPTTGTTAATAAAGNDPRLSDARTPTTHTHPATAISDSTPVGRSVVTAADAAAARAAIGAGTSNLAIGTSSGSAKVGNWLPAISDVSGLTQALADKADKADMIIRGVVNTEADLAGQPAGIYFVRG